MLFIVHQFKISRIIVSFVAIYVVYIPTFRHQLTSCLPIYNRMLICISFSIPLARIIIWRNNHFIWTILHKKTFLFWQGRMDFNHRPRYRNDLYLALSLSYSPKTWWAGMDLNHRHQSCKHNCALSLSYLPYIFGAACGNRTRNVSLEDCGFTIKLRPRKSTASALSTELHDGPYYIDGRYSAAAGITAGPMTEGRDHGRIRTDDLSHNLAPNRNYDIPTS